MKVSEIGYTVSQHYGADDVNRENAIKRIGGDGNVIAMFYVDKGHRNGMEKHYLTDNAIIVVVNATTNVLCTKLIARPQQLLRYRQWGLKNELDERTRKMRNWIVPKKVLNLARLHQKEQLNLT